MNEVEVSRVKVIVDGEDGEKTLKSLKEELKDVNAQIRDMKKAGEEGSETWQSLKLRQSELVAEVKEYTSAIDLSDASLNELTARSRQLQNELRGLKVGSDEWIEKMNEVGKVDARIQEVREEMARLKKETLENSDAYKELERRQAELNEQYREQVRNIDLNDASMTQLNAKARLLEEELKDLKVGSQEWIDKMKELAQVESRISDVGDEMDELRDKNDRNALSWKRVKEAAIGTFAAFSLEDIIQEVVQFGTESVKSAAEMSDAMSDIEKATDMTTTEVEGLVDAFERIDTRTSLEDLTEIGVVAGQLGIAKNEVLGFTESVDRAVVALGDEFTGGAEEVAGTLGGLQKLFRETKDLEAGKAINDIGSALNALGAAGSATAPVVADFTARMGQLGDLAPQISQTMGLGAAFQELGLTAEIAAGGLSNILLGAAKATDLFAEQLGISEKEMRKLINTDPNAFLLKLAESLKGLPADQVAKQLDNLGIKSQEATKVMSLLKDQTDLVAQRQKLAADEMKKGTSLTDEFNKKNTNAAAELAKAGKELKAFSLDVGQGLIPVVLKAAEGLIAFINTIRAIPGFLNENKTALALLVTGLVLFNAQTVAAAASSLALAAAEKGRAIATGAVTAAQTLLNVAMTANPIGLVIAAVAALVGGLMLLYNNSQTVRAAVAGLWEAIKTGIQVVRDFAVALKNLNFAEAADIWASGGKRVAESFSKGYKDKIKSEQAGIEKDHQAHVDKKVAASKAGAEKSAQNDRNANKNALGGMGDDNNLFLTDDQKKKAKHEAKVADDKRKANADALAAIAKANIDAIADDQKRKMAQLAFERDQDIRKINESIASHDLKTKQIEAINRKYEADKAALEKAALDKKEKEEREVSEKLEKMRIAAITNEYQRKVAELNAHATREIAEIERSKFDEAQKAEAIRLINEKLSRDVTATNDAQRKDELKKNQEKRDKELASEKALFDGQFQAAIANSDLNIELAKNNANKLYELKAERLRLEYEYNRKKLIDEANEEKEKNQTLIQDADKRAEAERNIDSRLKAALQSADIKFNQDKSALLEEHHERRRKNTEQFFNAVNDLATGDYKSFMNFLNEKLKNDAAANNQRLQDFNRVAQATLSTASQVVSTMQALNQKYLDSQLAKIKKEQDTQTKSWEAQYKAGKISKEEYEKQVAKINADAAAKEKEEKLKAWKRDQALRITMAVIDGAAAAMKSMALMGWPLGLIGVAAAAVTTALQIATIKKQTPPTFERGGFIRNAGVAGGSRHGQEYGDSGIALVDRKTGSEVGEMEGGEPIMILSRETYKNNKQTVDLLLHSSLHRRGAPIFRDGGVYTDYVGSRPAFNKKRRYDDGGIVEINSAEDISSAVGSDAGVASASESNAATAEQIQKSQELMKEIGENTAATVEALASVNNRLKTANTALSTHGVLLSRIASKELSVSVHNVVNVWNHIEVVAGASNLR